MLKCDGYKMFHGTVHVTPALRADGTRFREPFDLTGTWLFKPHYGAPGFLTWTCRPDGSGLTESFYEDTLSDFRDDAGTKEEEIING